MQDPVDLDGGSGGSGSTKKQKESKTASKNSKSPCWSGSRDLRVVGFVKHVGSYSLARASDVKGIKLKHINTRNKHASSITSL